jgi:glycosyltransferase involved in cell wall biosynthesis
MFRPCLLIPSYNNPATVPTVLNKLAAFDLPCLLVDDGSREEVKAIYREAAAKHDWVQLKHRPENGGKGAAVKTGLLWARELGFSHALQIDADDQHDSDEIPRFIAAAEKHPTALVLGRPTFGEDVPKARLYGRQLSVVLVYLETLSRQIEDPLFGFRVYPVSAAAAVISKAHIGDRMDFDPEIAVRLVWEGLPVVTLKTPVRYPENAVSHFHMVRDNLKITWMHTRLICGMLLRSPWLLLRKRPKP